MAAESPQRKPRDFTHLSGRLFDTPLAMDARKIDAIVPVFLERMRGDTPQKTFFDDDDRVGEDEQYLDAQGIWNVSIIGSLVRRSSWIDAYSGLRSYASIRDCVRKGAKDARVKGILLRIDSYGGEAAGLFELCDDLRKLRADKPIWAVLDVDGLSAAYAIATCANRILVAPSGMAGSIGVVAVHLERSQMNEAMGLTYTVFRAGERKADFNPYERLAPEAADRLQASMDRNRATFVETVVRNRPNLTTAAVMATEGAWYDADEALKLGLVDQLATFEAAYQQFVDGLATGNVVALPPPEPTAPIEPDEVDETEEDAMTEKNEQTTTAAAPTPVPQPESAAAPTPPNPAANNVVVMPQASQGEDLLKIAGMCDMSGFPAMTGQLQKEFADGKITMQGIQDKLTNLRAEKDKTPELSSVQGSGSGSLFGTFGAAPTPAILDSWDKAFDRAAGKI